MSEFLRVTLVSEEEFWIAFRESGGIYFIRNRVDGDNDEIKIGYTRDPLKRLSNLQVGSSRRLELIGLIAAEQRVEERIHFQMMEGRIRGEWFWDRGVTFQWLMDMTQGEPLYRSVWRFVKGRSVLSTWDDATQSHTRHVFNDVTGEWEPPLK